MYEPMKQVAIRFPKWLEERRNVLSEKELKEYGIYLICCWLCREGCVKLTTRYCGLPSLFPGDNDSVSAFKSWYMRMR